MSTLRFLRVLLATSLRASLALRGAFFAHAAFMLLNNLVFFVMWWIFFDRFEEVRGWYVHDMAAIYGIVAGAFGLAVVLGAGVRDLSQRIEQGDLDPLLTQPKSPLLQSVASKSQPSGWGDLVSAFLLLALSGYLTPLSLVAAVTGMALGAAVLLACAVLLHSLAFWFKDTETLARQAWEFLIVFSVYPSPVFGGWVKALLYTVFPAGFIAYLPVELVRDFSWATLGLATAGAAAFVAAALIAFARGLRRYESGSRLGAGM